MAKSALNQLIESFGHYRHESNSDSIDIDKLIQVITTEYLEKEKQQLMNAYDSGSANVIQYAMLEGYDDNELPINSEQYYKENFE